MLSASSSSSTQRDLISSNTSLPVPHLRNFECTFQPPSFARVIHARVLAEGARPEPSQDEGPCFLAVHDGLIPDHLASKVIQVLENPARQKQDLARFSILPADHRPGAEWWPRAGGAVETIYGRVMKYLRTQTRSDVCLLEANARTAVRSLQSAWEQERAKQLLEGGDFKAGSMDGDVKAGEPFDAHLKSKLTAAPAMYLFPWHINAVRSRHWRYTAIIFLSSSLGSGNTRNDTSEQVIGGGTAFVRATDEVGRLKNGTLVLPRKGRVVLFSTGTENVHRVLPVVAGFRAIIQTQWARGEPSSSHPTGLPICKNIDELSTRRSPRAWPGMPTAKQGGG